MKSHERLDLSIDKARKFIIQQKNLAKQVKVLEMEVQSLKLALQAEVLKNDDLLNKIKIIKLAQNIGSPDMADTDMKELKRKINEYIKEIDHCLTMLND